MEAGARKARVYEMRIVVIYYRYNKFHDENLRFFLYYIKEGRHCQEFTGNLEPQTDENPMIMLQKSRYHRVKPFADQSRGLPRNMRVNIYPKVIAAQMPAAVPVKPPVSAPKIPVSSTALRTPLASE